jgi:hypothetical protein
MSNRLAFALLGIACISAAAGGGYLATRQNAIPVPASAQAVPAASVTPAPVAQQPVTTAPVPVATAAPVPAAPPAVQETEAPVEARGSQGSKATEARSSKTSAPVATTAKRAPASQGTLTKSWPSSASQPPAVAAPAQPAPVAPEPPAQRPEERITPDPPRAPEPPRPTFEELVVSRDSVIGVQTENRISSETARVEDRVDARVTRDVRVGDRVAIPSGARVIGTVTQVEKGGKFKELAKLGIRFHTIVMVDGTRLPISTETIMRFGEAPSATAKVGGGAVGGAILGAILGGSKGAAIGATAGAGAGAAAVQAGDRNAVVLQPGTPLTARILSPVTVTIERN